MVAAIVVCGILVPAAAAEAQATATSGYATVVDGKLIYSPPTGLASDVRMTLSPVGEIVLEEAAAGISSGVGCHPYGVLPRPTVACPARTIWSIEARFGAGNDRMDASAITGQRMIVYGGAGDDVLTTGQTSDSIHGGDGADTIYAEDSNDDLYGDGGDDRLFGGQGSDDVEGGPGVNTMDGGGESGYDYLIFTDSPTGVGVDLASQQLTYLDGAATSAGTAIGFETVVGSDHDDRIFGDDLDNTVVGGHGNDEIHGRAGDDRVGGFEGADLLYGGPGADELQGWDGDDQISGGDGDDVIRGMEGADTLFGDGGGDLVMGEEDDDRIHGGDGRDVLSGSDGDDSLTGDAGSDFLSGHGGADRLFAQDGEVDNVDCGSSDVPVDTVDADRIDVVAANCETVTTPNVAPTNASITAPRMARTGEAIEVIGSAFDSDGDPLTFQWDFGDGSTATGASVIHVYDRKGRYTLRLTVTDDHGGSVVVEHVVHVHGGG
ncbi:MAG TPA: PKD domain-containing protein [Mycobacteriales bacterium]|nr:PKD domain-containing protein [Mycobacteriales bacterium]